MADTTDTTEGKTRIKQGWPKKTPKEREQCLSTIRACGSQMMKWAEVAAMLGVSRDTLWHWRKSDSKIDEIYSFGRADLAEEIFERLKEKALAGGVVKCQGDHVSGEEGNTAALLLISKRLLDLGDVSTHQVVTPSDLAGDKDEAGHDERRTVALRMLDLEMLDFPIGEGPEPDEVELEEPDETEQEQGDSD